MSKQKTKHEKVWHELDENATVSTYDAKSRTLTLGFNKKETISILSKHYDQECAPELTRGMWVYSNLSVSKEPRLYLEDRCMFVDGESSAVLNKESCYKPHTFTAKDLKLLDTEEVTYRLFNYDDKNYRIEIDRGQSISHCKQYSFGSYYPTAHEAIQEAFNARIEHEYFKREVLNNG